MARKRNNYPVPITVEYLQQSAENGDFEPHDGRYREAWHDRGRFHTLRLEQRAEAEQIFSGVTTTIAVRWSKRWQRFEDGTTPLRIRHGHAGVLYVKGLVNEDAANRELILYCVRGSLQAEHTSPEVA